MGDYLIELGLKKRMEELGLKAYHQKTKTFTRFLTPPQQQYALGFGKRIGVLAKAFGGYNQAERAVVGFLGDSISATKAPLPFEGVFPVVPLTLTWERPFNSKIGHRDVLGALLATGLDRSFVGDILVSSGQAEVFVLSPSEKILLGQLKDIGSAPVKIEEGPGREGENQTEIPMKAKSTVASLRLDAVLAAALNQSREEAALLVQRGLVKINHLPTEKREKNITLGDIISVRGYGRIEIAHIGNPNRKKRIPLLMHLFK